MHEDRRSAANGSPETTLVGGEQWRLPALDRLWRAMPGRRWLRFAAALEERHLAAFVRCTPQRRDQGQGVAASSQGVGHVPARFVSGDLPRRGGPPLAGATAWRPDDAPAQPDRPDRRARRLGSGPDTAAKLPVPDPQFPPVRRRSVTADAQGATAGARVDVGQIDERLPAGGLHGLARTLDPYVQGYLSRLLDLRIPAVQIHTGQVADATARRFNADAVSVGPHIMFRAGRFAPESASGLGLLGHELTHVAHTQSDRSAGARDRAALAREELAAIENERRVLRHASGQPVLSAQAAAIAREPTSRAVRSTPAPRAASVDRDVAPAPGSGAVSPSPELSAQQLDALKEAIYRDLMDRIRTEFERGA